MVGKLNLYWVLFSLLAFLLALYLFLFCSSCKIYDLQTKQIFILFGIALCSISLISTLINIKSGKSRWMQTLIPAFILFQLILLFYEKISFTLAFLIIPVVEIFFVLTIVLLTKKKLNNAQNPDNSFLRNILDLLLPAFLVRWIIFEVTIISFAIRGLVNFFKKKNETGWSYWKNSHFPIVFILLIFVAPLELVVINFLLNIQSITVHILFALLYIWGFLYIYGFWISIKLLPHQIIEGEVFLYRGGLSNTRFSVEIIESVKVINQQNEFRVSGAKETEAADLSVPGTAMVEIVLKKSARVENILKKSEQFVKKILISVDQPVLFRDEILKIQTRN